MKLFTITLMDATGTSQDLLKNELTKEIKKRYQADADIVATSYDGYIVIEATGRRQRFSMDLQADAYYKLATAIMADWIVAVEEEKRLRQLIVQEFHYEKEEEVQAILSYLSNEMSAENQETWGMLERRKSQISTALLKFLKENKDLNIDGFIKFRLNNYMEELREVVEYAVDEFLLDRQYKEFISLLQYFVYIQEAKLPYVHLLHNGSNEFVLLDDKMEPMDTSGSNMVLTMELLEKDINFEDVIVSTLVSISPKLIYIHTREPELQIIQTISQIFEKRVEICEYCFLCHNLDHPAVSDYNEV